MGYRVAIYSRLSKDETGAQTATARQEADARSFAALRGWDVVDVLSDVDLSAYRKGVDRPGYEALLAALRAHEVDGVLVWKLDRLVRRAAEFERFWAVCEEASGFLASVTEPIDTSTELGMVIVRVLVAFAQLESATMSLRIRRAIEEKARAGKPHHGGRRPFGLTEDWQAIVPEEAALVRDAARRVAQGDSLRSIVLEWNAAGVPTVTGGRWATNVLRSMLLSRRLLGQRTHRGQVVAEVCWPAILDVQTFELVRAVLTDAGRRNPAQWRVDAEGNGFVLSGLVRCGRCGKRLRGGRTHSGAPRYVCPPKPEGCNGCTILRDPLDELIAERMFVALDSPAMPRALQRLGGDDDEREVLAEIAGVEAALEQLARDHYAHHRIGRGEFFAARQTIERHLEAARRRLVRRSRRSAAEALVGQGASLSERWATMTLHQRRGVVEAVVERIDVGPGRPGYNRFDPERVPRDAVHWRI